MMQQSPGWHCFDGGNEEDTFIVRVVEGKKKVYNGNWGIIRKKGIISKAQLYLLKT